MDDQLVGPEAPLTHLSQDDKPLEWVSLAYTHVACAIIFSHTKPQPHFEFYTWQNDNFRTMHLLFICAKYQGSYRQPRF